MIVNKMYLLQVINGLLVQCLQDFREFNKTQKGLKFQRLDFISSAVRLNE